MISIICFKTKRLLSFVFRLLSFVFRLLTFDYPLLVPTPVFTVPAADLLVFTLAFGC